MNRRSVPGWIAGLFAFLALAGSLPATDFIRGDANVDRVVSIADAHAILRYLPGQASLECLDSANANGDSKIDVADPIWLMNYLFRNGPASPPPFPLPGSALDGVRVFGCEAYGNGTPLADPAARLEVLDAVAPGGDQAAVSLVLAVSSSNPIAGYAATLLRTDGVIRDILPDPRDLSGTLDNGFNLTHETRDDIQVGFLASLSGDRSIPAGSGAPVLELRACLAYGTPAGTYPLVLAGGELVDHASGRAISPELVSGTLTVLADIAGNGSSPECPAPPDPSAPREVHAFYKLGGGEAWPGAAVTVPFIILANAGVEGYAFSVDFDERVLEATAVEPVWRKPDGRDYDFQVYEFDNQDLTPGNAGTDEGFLVGAAVPSLNRSVVMPANTDHHALDFQLQVRPTAPVGSTELRFLDGGQVSSAEPVPNQLTVLGSTYLPEQLGSFVFIGGVLHVLPDVTIFIRGDANGDEAVNMSDALTALNYLFLGSAAPHCLDAGDTNDDGELNIADAIGLLQHLFLGGSAPAAPFPLPGEDPTADDLRCRARSG